MAELAYKDEARYEKINGQWIMMSPARAEHVITVGNIYSEFRQYLKGKRCIPFTDGVVYILDEKEENQFIPDVSILCDKTKIGKNGKIYGAPDLVVEVLSRSTARRDKMEKFQAYEKAGVKEYWIVNPYERGIEVYVRKDDRLQISDVCHAWSEEELKEYEENPDQNKIAPHIKLKVSLYDDLYIDMNEIFEF